MKNINEVFDEVISRAKESGNLEEVLSKTKTYAKKSAEAIEISRKRIELLDAKTKLTKAYEKYGKLHFAVYEGNEADEQAIEATAQEILMLKSQCEFLEAEIDAFKEKIANDFETKVAQKKTDDIIVDDVEVVEVDSE